MKSKTILALLAGLLLAGTGPAAADNFPSRQVVITTLYAVGGGVDLVARAVAQKLSEKWKVPVIVENKPGAGGTIAGGYVARQPADGYSLFATDVSFSISPSLYKKISFDPIKDLTPVIMLNTVTQAFTISPTLPVNSVAEFVDYAKKNPDKLTYASAGVGSLPHLGAEMFKKATGIHMVHVPYRGAVAAFTDVMASRANLYIGALGTPYPQIQDGKLRAIAVMQKNRSALIPNVPSIVEAGYPDLDFGAYYGILAPSGTPRPIVDKIAADMKEALATPEVKRVMDTLGNETVGLGPDEFAAFLKKDIARWQLAIKFAGISSN